MYLKVYGGLFDFSVSHNQTNWFIVSVERLRFGFELDIISSYNKTKRSAHFNVYLFTL